LVPPRGKDGTAEVSVETHGSSYRRTEIQVPSVTVVGNGRE
jgi:hypothetical protein